MNKVLLVGRITRDIELRTTPSGKVVSRFTIAVSHNYTNENGERGADFINCIVWGRQAENVSKYCKKGSLISAEGRITNRNYDAQDGTKRYVTEVLCEQISFLNTSDKKGNEQQDIIQNTTSIEPVKEESDPWAEFGQEIASSDLELPFE